MRHWLTPAYIVNGRKKWGELDYYNVL